MKSACLFRKSFCANIQEKGNFMVTANTETLTYTGAKILIETLTKLGVDTIFGYPGGIVLGIYDELYKQQKIQHILVRHEQSAVHAAEGYARVSGKCGVVLVTSGPGASNTVTGIANAYLDGYPVIVFTGQVSSNLIGKDAFQEVNIVEMTKSCTKAAFQVRNAKDLKSTIEKAFEIALSGKQGPVVVDLAKNIFTETAEYSGEAELTKSELPIKTDNLPTVLESLCNAKRPVIVAGGGVVQANASSELFKFAKLLNIPVVNTMMGLGTYPPDDENYTGMIGIFGSVGANKTVRESDLVFSVGARFNDRVTCCFGNKELERNFIQLDINESEISRIIPAKNFLVGDAKKVLESLKNLFNSGNYSFDKTARNQWLSKVRRFLSENEAPQKFSNHLHSFEVIRHIYDFCKDFNPTVATEVGQHQMWTAKEYKFSTPRKFLTSGGLGTMGFGLPAAIGASLAEGKKSVVCIAGDGSFQMNASELATCKDYNLPVKIFLIDNGYLGMVRQLQQKFYGSRYSETKISNPDFVKLAESFGVKAIRVSKEEEIMPALKEVFATNEPALIDFVVEPMEVV